MHEVVIRMAFIIFKECNFDYILQNDSKNSLYFEISLKIHITRRRNVFRNVCYLNSSKKNRIMHLQIEVPSKISEKKCKITQKWSHWIRQKLALFQSKSALFNCNLLIFSSVHLWFFALKSFVSTAVQSWSSAVQRFLGNAQLWIRTEKFLNQSSSELNVSDTSTWVPLVTGIRLCPF